MTAETSGVSRRFAATSNRCSLCGSHLQPHQQPLHDRIAEREAELRKWCQDAARWLSPDGRVKEADAAEILGLSEGRLANLRYAGSGPEFYRAGNGRGGVTYRVGDLAVYIEAGRK